MSRATQSIRLALALSLLIFAMPNGPASAESIDEIGKLTESGLAAYNSKKYADSEKAYLKAIDLLKKDKDAEIALSDAYQNLATVYKALGKKAEASKTHQAFEQIRRRLHLPESSRSTPQSSLLNATDRHGVDKMFKETGSIIDGKDLMFPKDLTCKGVTQTEFKNMMHTAYELRQAGDPIRASIAFRTAIAKAHCFPAPNVMIVQSLNGLAGVYRSTGRNLASLMLYEAAIKDQEKLSKKEDQFLATLLDNSALVHAEMGNFAQAKSNQERALAIYKKTLPPDSMDLAQTMSNLAETYALMKQPDKAEPLMQASISIYKKHKPADDPSILIAMDNLAALYVGKGQYARAEQIQHTVVAGLEKQYKKHPVLAEALGNLSATLYAEKKYPESEKLLKRSIDMQKEMFGDGHPKTVNSMKRYADFLNATGRKKEAADYSKTIPKN